MGFAQLLVGESPPAGLYLLMGPPGSGKSTFRHAWWTARVLSPDDLRLAMLGTAFDLRREGVVWMRTRQQAERLLQQEQAVLLDATLVSRSLRRPWVQLAKGTGHPVWALACWDPDVTPAAVLLARNRARETPVPEARALAMIKAWQPPAPAEGFAGVWTVLSGVGPAGAPATGHGSR